MCVCRERERHKHVCVYMDIHSDIYSRSKSFADSTRVYVNIKV